MIIRKLRDELGELRQEWEKFRTDTKRNLEEIKQSICLTQEKIRAQLTIDIKQTAQNRISELEEQRADWRNIIEIEQWRDQKIGELDRFLSSISEAFQEGEASKVFQKTQELLQDKGADEALVYLEAKSDQRWKLIWVDTSKKASLEIAKKMEI